MTVKEIELSGFRNLKNIKTDFSEGINVISGDNAQGKTNLLEAVYFLTSAKSFRTYSDRELINHSEDFANIKAKVFSGERDKTIEARLGRGRRKELFVNGVRLKRAADLSGALTAVLFCPEDLNLIRDGAVIRRRLMDSCISQLKPRYAAALHEFNKVYEGKTRILRDWEEKPSLLELLDQYDEALCRMSAELIHYRAHFIKRLSPESEKIHREFSGGEELKIEYRTLSTVSDPFLSPAEIFPQIMEHQISHKTRERAAGMCLSGAHKDDMVITIDGKEAKAFASQGQVRTAVLSIKLAEREIHRQMTGEFPVLLLDDVLSELDASRQGFVLNSIQDGQVFITCCEDDEIKKRTGGRIFATKNGSITG